MTGAGGVSTRDAVLLVARREFTERVRDRGFLVSCAVMLVILLAASIIPGLGGGDDRRFGVAFVGPQAPRLEQIAERQARLLDVTLDVRAAPDRATAEADVREGRADALVDTGPPGGEIVVDRDLDDRLAAVLQSAWAAAERDRRLDARGIDAGAVEQALAVPAMTTVTLDEDAEARDQRRGVAFVGTFVLYGMLILFCTWVANGVVEEKSSRIVEILLATIPARALLAGKILGIGLLGLCQMLLTAALGLAAASATGTVDVDGQIVLPVALVVAWFVLGYALYACMFAAAAARVSRQEDLQNVLGPATSLLVATFVVAVWSGNAGGTVAEVLAYVPPFSAMLQPIMTAGGDMSPAGNVVAVVVALAAAAALIRVAGRLYEGSVLRTGARVTLRDAWRRG